MIRSRLAFTVEDRGENDADARLRFVDRM